MNEEYKEKIEEIKSYYANLLIMQYHDKPKAVATIKETIGIMISDLILLQIRDGFNILKKPYAVGKQLDCIGEWVGIDRRFSGDLPLYPWFSLIDWEQTKEDVLQGGLQDWDKPIIQDGGILGYDDTALATNKTLLKDEVFLPLIKLKIIKNTSSHTMGDLDKKLKYMFDNKINISWGYSDNQLTSDEPAGMTLTYNYKPEYDGIMEIAKIKNAIPKPMGMLLRYKSI